MHPRTQLALVALVVLLTASGPRAVAAAATSLEEALDQGEARGVPVLVDVFATWCGPCKAFDRDAQQNPEIQEVLGKVVVYKIDGESPHGLPFAQQYRVTKFPTYILMNGDGNVIHSWMGYKRDSFLESLSAALVDPIPIKERRERFESAPTADDALLLATYYGARGETQKSFAYYEQASGLNEDPDVDYSTRVFVIAFEGYRDGKVTGEQVVRSAKRVLEWEGHTPIDAMYLTRYLSAVAQKEGDQELMVPFLEAAIRETEGSSDPQIMKMRQGLMLDYTLLVEKDVDAAVTMYKDRLPAGWEQNPSALNAFAWWCFENRINLEEAEARARKGIELADKDESRAMLLDTLAEIRNARGSCQDAVLYIEQAIEADPKRQHYRKQLERFQKELADQG
jgi:thiol-disulfide isomerase/thioredoxin